MYVYVYVCACVCVCLIGRNNQPRTPVAAYTNAENAHLEILPSGDTQTKPIGSSIILTCKPNVDEPSLVEDMQWFDPHNNVIESLK